MAQVALVINGRSYRVACDSGQEERVRELGRVVDETVTGLAGRIGQAGEMQLLVMAALLLADQAEAAAGEGAGPTPGLGPASGLARDDDREGADEDAESAEEAAVAVIEACASRLEGIAARLERT